MKALVAAACIAVLAFVGYFFWGEYSKAKAIADEAARIESVRSEIFDLAKGSAGLSQTEKARSYCDLLNKINTNNPEKSHARERVLQNCRYFGYL